MKMMKMFSVSDYIKECLKEKDRKEIEEIEEIVRSVEELPKNSYDSYLLCVNKMSATLTQGEKFDDSDVVYLQAFLHEWYMCRALRTRRTKGDEKEKTKGEWEVWTECREWLKENFDGIKKFHGIYLDGIDINQYEKDIKNLLDGLRKIVGPISAAKILHVMAPAIFPIWDTKVRKSKLKLGDDGSAYFGFMSQIKEFLSSNTEEDKQGSNLISELAEKYYGEKGRQFKLKILDAIIWGNERENKKRNNSK
ncbi:MAG: hypothetical protein ABH874_05385 [Methanobacteriota archaeon]